MWYWQNVFPIKNVVRVNTFSKYNTSIFCISSICFVVLLWTSCKQKLNSDKVEVLEEQVATDNYTNPVLDVNFADPAVIKASDGYYYAYGTNTEVDGKFVHIQIRKSKNLIDWENAGDALPQKPTWADTDFWAPHVLYDNELETYFLYYSGESNDEALGKCLGVATSKSPIGPFTDEGTPLLCGESFINIDPMAFDDPKTNKKLLYWGSEFKGIKVQELADDRIHFKEGTEPQLIVPSITNGDPANYQNLVEGVWVTYKAPYYYAYFSGDNCCGDGAHYAVMVARSKEATGPFEMYSKAVGTTKSVILEKNTRWIAPGHNSIVTDASGQEWVVYHAIDASNKSKGRVMLIDKITYKEGWPQINNGKPSTTLQIGPRVE